MSWYEALLCLALGTVTIIVSVSIAVTMNVIAEELGEDFTTIAYGVCSLILASAVAFILGALIGGYV